MLKLCPRTIAIVFLEAMPRVDEFNPDYWYIPGDLGPVSVEKLSQGTFVLSCSHENTSFMTY